MFLVKEDRTKGASLARTLGKRRLRCIGARCAGARSSAVSSPKRCTRSGRFDIKLTYFSFRTSIVTVIRTTSRPFGLFKPKDEYFVRHPLVKIVAGMSSPCTGISVIEL